VSGLGGLVGRRDVLAQLGRAVEAATAGRGGRPRAARDGALAEA
jgi:hypothetical protein